MKYAFAGDRLISCQILKYIIDQGYLPSLLFVSSKKRASHSEELIKISKLPKEKIIIGLDFKSQENIDKLKALKLDYIIGIHYPYIIPKAILEIPMVGFLNLHPSYLPYNKGWHTPSWAILEGTPYGATLHFMSEELDQGDIIHQKRIEIKPKETATELYARVLDLEKEVFFEAFSNLVDLNPQKHKQEHEGTSHGKNDLKNIQELNLNQSQKLGYLIDKLRALTTNNISESAFFIKNGKKYAVQVKITEI